ncbi:antibiotic biosynthesis monooxygenase [Cryobacterium sp. TMT1-62]|uniref:putative quinol monooxygenase n=1 Tax=unclassified Cryobacterium TaxID=2649013 RepID=UPI00106B4334|nr:MULTISPECIES: putative quinol monooxygenase [unclassified Cryobacterium]TFB57171.1 antibiotic biosynthesis monooxygenase [Cryobacterium sp. Sr3]TFC71746.1 antibiotic biosynthesis monooxygenase [Cryobacterium sp. TMT2-4]TFD32874.1 antibiotic biosynthesis monooxygenase [Cryobacterium sp. TMT1-62]
MSVVVVAVLTPKPGRSQELLDAFAVVSPTVHAETGCELYAAHTDGDLVVMVERWASVADLAVHATGAGITELGALTDDALAAPTDVKVLQNVPFGDPAKGTIQEGH